MAVRSQPSTALPSRPVIPPGLYPRAYHRPGLLDWLEQPRAGYGLRFADENGGWDFWDYPRLASAVASAAEDIRQLRARPDGVVSIVTRTGPEFIAAFFGTLLAGNTPSPLAFPLTMRDRSQYVEHAAAILEAADPTLVLVDEAVHELVTDASAKAKLPHRPQVLGVREDGATPCPGTRAELALLQFTSGSSGRPRGVRVTWENIESNIAMIRHWLHMSPNDQTATWLPLYHDMGLIGTLLTPVVNQTDVWIMRPDQFVRNPLRWLDCFGSRGVEIGVAPNFGFAYAAKRIDHDVIARMDFSRWRTAIVAAERLDAQVLGRFAEQLAPQGFCASSFMPAYGLAEATLAVTGVALRNIPRAVCLDWSSVRMGEQAIIADEASLVETQRIGHGEDWLIGCGEPHPQVSISVLDMNGDPLPERFLGEIAVEGPTIAHGYQGTASESTHFVDGYLRTGDAGFIDRGELFVVGRLGDSIKVRGRTVFVEDVEARLATVEGIHKGKCVVLAGSSGGRDFLVALVETPSGKWVDGVASILQSEGGQDIVVIVLSAERGTIERTSSGKPRRRVLWQAFLDGSLVAESLYDSSTANA
jgi:acyl-CoA synthetase (AMP-forming)/AMP-acid ligase II